MLNALFQQHTQWVADEGSQTSSFYVCRHVLRCPAGAGGSVAHFEFVVGCVCVGVGVCACIHHICDVTITVYSPLSTRLHFKFGCICFWHVLFSISTSTSSQMTFDPLHRIVGLFFFSATKACLKFASTNFKSNKRSKRQEGKLGRSRSAPDRQPLLPVMDRSRCWWEKGWGREEKTQAADFRHSTTH